MDTRKEKARQLWNLASEAKDQASRLLCLYDGLYLFHGKDTYLEAERHGISKERLLDAVDYARGDSESYHPVVLEKGEYETLESMLENAIK